MFARRIIVQILTEFSFQACRVEAVNDSNPTHDRTVLAAILFTDAVGFSAYAREDESRALAAIGADHAEMRVLCERHDGRVVKSTGDGLLMMFDSAVSAFQCALDILREAADSPLKHRIGVHLGDVTVSKEDVMGDGVNVASRLQELARPGEMCASQTVVDVVQSRLKFALRPMGVQTLKNIPQPIRVYAVDPFGPDRRRPHALRWGAKAVGFAFGTVALLAIGIPLWMLALRPPVGPVVRDEPNTSLTLSPELARYLESGAIPVEAPDKATPDKPAAAPTPEDKALAKKMSDLETLQAWFEEQMKAYPKDKPLTVAAKDGAGSTQVWKEPTAGVVAKGPADDRAGVVKAGTFVDATRMLISRMPNGPEKVSMMSKLESLSVPRKTAEVPPPGSNVPPPPNLGFARHMTLPKEVQIRIEEMDELNTVLSGALKEFTPDRPFSLESPGRRPLSLWFDADGELVGDTGDGAAAPVEMATYIRLARDLTKSMPDGPEKSELLKALEKLGRRRGTTGSDAPGPNLEDSGSL